MGINQSITKTGRPKLEKGNPFILLREINNNIMENYEIFVNTRTVLSCLLVALVVLVYAIVGVFLIRSNTLAGTIESLLVVVQRYFSTICSLESFRYFIQDPHPCYPINDVNEGADRYLKNHWLDLYQNASKLGSSPLPLQTVNGQNVPRRETTKNNKIKTKRNTNKE